MKLKIIFKGLPMPKLRYKFNVNETQNYLYVPQEFYSGGVPNQQAAFEVFYYPVI